MASNDVVISTIQTVMASIQKDNLVLNNLKFFSLSLTVTTHENKPVEHDSEKWIKSIEREYSEKIDKTKCQFALYHALGTAKTILEELIEIHDSNWELVSKEFVTFCKRPENSTSLQLELLSLTRKIGESLQDLYVRTSAIGVRILKDKPHLTSFIQEQMCDCFAKAISDKFYHSLSSDDKTSLRNVFTLAQKYAEKRPELLTGPTRATTAKIAAISDNPQAATASNPQTQRKYFDTKHGSHGNSSQNNACTRCNGAHSSFNCPRKRLICHFCKNVGHIIRECRKRANASKRGNSNNMGFAGGQYHMGHQRVNAIGTDASSRSFTLDSLVDALDSLNNDEFLEVLAKKKLQRTIYYKPCY